MKTSLCRIYILVELFVVQMFTGKSGKLKKMEQISIGVGASCYIESVVF